MAAIHITPDQQRQYREDGFFVLERVIPPEHLELLRGEAQNFIERIHGQMDREKTDVLGINHRNKRYFIHECVKQRPTMGAFVYSDLMAEICRATLGANAFLFWDQYVLKCAEVGMKFGWHQDSGYVDSNGISTHKPYLSCWCALDDVNEENGTVYMLPYGRAGSLEIQPHVKEEGTNDLVGYHGSDPGVPVIVPAGSIACFSSVCFHRSGFNRTAKMRRVYLAQYSCEPIVSPDGKLRGQAVPFVKDGERIN